MTEEASPVGGICSIRPWALTGSLGVWRFARNVIAITICH